MHLFSYFVVLPFLARSEHCFQGKTFLRTDWISVLRKVFHFHFRSQKSFCFPFWLSDTNENYFERAKMGEHTFFATFFIFFSSRTEKCYSFSPDVFWIPPTVASGRYVWSVGLLRPRPPLKGTPAFAPNSTAPDSTTLHSFGFEKSFGIQKSLSRTKHFLFSRRKKKSCKERLAFSGILWICVGDVDFLKVFCSQINLQNKFIQHAL